MGHGPATKWDGDKSIPHKIKLGLWMFLSYFILYGGFIVINVVDPKLMGTDIGSLNLAIVYGFSLIVTALILALIYNHQSNKLERKYKDKQDDVKGHQ